MFSKLIKSKQNKHIMKKKYITPTIYVLLFNVRASMMQASGSRTGKMMSLIDDDPITKQEDILTKGRSLFDDDSSFGLEEW